MALNFSEESSSSPETENQNPGYKAQQISDQMEDLQSSRSQFKGSWQYLKNITAVLLKAKTQY